MEQNKSTTTCQIDDPSGVINALQARISSLENQLAAEKASAQERLQSALGGALMHLRLHEVIPLYVGSKAFSAVRDEVLEVSPALRDVLNQTWLLENAPVSNEVKSAFRDAANHGLSRW